MKEQKVKFEPKSVKEHKTAFQSLLNTIINPDSEDLSKWREFDIQDEEDGFKLFIAVVGNQSEHALNIVGRRLKGRVMPISLEYMPVLRFIAQVSQQEFTNAGTVTPLASGNFLMVYNMK